MQSVFMQKGASLHNRCGFTDGTVRPICRPHEMQRVVYNGHKRVYTIKFQFVVTFNGIIANLYGLVEGCHHGSGMLAYSGLLQHLEQDSYISYQEPMCLYGDPANLLVSIYKDLLPTQHLANVDTIKP